MNYKKLLFSMVSFLTVVAVIISLASIAQATSTDNIRLCHFTEGGHYNDITISPNGVFTAKHDVHQDGQDIIPPFV